MSFWIVEKRDDVICGQVSGIKTQQVIEGPFDTWDQALEVKSQYRRYGSVYYVVVESDSKPKTIKDVYEFVDASYEFSDV